MRNSALLAVVVVALTLTGCQPTDPVVVPQPEPSSTPLFASEEEALAAAEEAFAAYLAVSDQIFAEGGVDPERLLSVATEAALEVESDGYSDFNNNSWRSLGRSTYFGFVLQTYDPLATTSMITAYACIDISEVDVIDASGSSIVSETRPDRTPFEVSFDRDGNSLLVAEKTVWTGTDFCV